eukprot:CAMPEP_0198224596 /NCGR_PEP_ID=MMETSP1445-20131203/97579_1 /TAXON_ID=36898 /ORGANISM="Pyramimonas sp., Strain CCMP2087" /LENGTH=328 /DNA_ID=CAMNT_0043903823 /DNA_START=521 /DNA_END=1504 /DNA_ORIENTATION=+
MLVVVALSMWLSNMCFAKAHASIFPTEYLTTTSINTTLYGNVVGLNTSIPPIRLTIMSLSHEMQQHRLSTALERATQQPAGDSQFVRLYKKLNARAPIVLATVGGSITAGNRIQKSKSYGNVLLEWFESKFPASIGRHVYINLGTPSCGSYFFQHCLNQLLHRKNVTKSDVDLWIMDTAANDIILSESPAKWLHLEATVRNILSADNCPTLMFIYFAAGYDKKWSNTEVEQQLVANHYGLATTSWLRFMQHTGGYKAKNLGRWLADGRTHPTIEGHALAARILQHLILRELLRVKEPSPYTFPHVMKGGFPDDPAPICQSFQSNQESW